MHKMLSHGKVIDNSWTLVAADVPTTDNLPTGDILVPLALWCEQHSVLKNHTGAVGVWLDSHEEVETLTGYLDQLPVVAINFPKFVDGRGFSSARLLRDRYHYQGEIRAIGSFIRDQLFLMQRCGFSQFSFSDEIDLQAATASLSDFSDGYQTAADQAEPLFKRLR